LLYYFVRGTLSPSFTPCKGDNIPLDPRNAAFGGFIIFLIYNIYADFSAFKKISNFFGNF
jgi:hypothetical protein